jgi:hypothetical protein
MRSGGHKEGIEMSIVGSKPIDIHEPNRLAEKLMAERYSFNPYDCPWDRAYWSSYQSNEATDYKDHHVSNQVREYRFSWLAGCAQGLLYARKNKLMTMREVTPASMWGVVAAAILEGTFACIFTSDKNYLWTQSHLTGNRLGITNKGLPDCTPRNIAKQLQANTDRSVAERLYNREKLSDSYHSPYVYYVRLSGRKTFVRDEIVKQAVYVARNIRKETLLAAPLSKQWYEVFGHTSELIDYFLEMGKESPIIPQHTTSIKYSM